MYYFVTKKSPNNIPYKKVSLKFKQHSKIRKEHVLIKYVFLIRFYHPYLLHSKDVVKPYYIKGVRKQSFAEVLQNSYSWKASKIYGKTPLLESLFNNVGGLKRLHRKCFPTIFAKFQEVSYPSLDRMRRNHTRAVWSLKNSWPSVDSANLLC